MGRLRWELVGGPKCGERVEIPPEFGAVFFIYRPGPIAEAMVDGLLYIQVGTYVPECQADAESGMLRWQGWSVK